MDAERKLCRIRNTPASDPYIETGEMRAEVAYEADLARQNPTLKSRLIKKETGNRTAIGLCLIMCKWPSGLNAEVGCWLLQVLKHNLRERHHLRIFATDTAPSLTTITTYSP